MGEMAFAMALVRRGFNVFSPIVDAGIDLVAERVSGDQPPFHAEYLSFQVRTSTHQPKDDWWYWTISQDSFRLGENVFYALVLQNEEELPQRVRQTREDIYVLIIPTKEIWEHVVRLESWQNGGDYGISVEPHYFENKHSNKWVKYLNAWGLLQPHA
jgi:hypothetical protein